MILFPSRVCQSFEMGYRWLTSGKLINQQLVSFDQRRTGKNNEYKINNVINKYMYICIMFMYIMNTFAAPRAPQPISKLK